MKRKKFSIIIKNVDNISAISSLDQNKFNKCDFEYLIVNNNIKNIDKYIANNNKFHVLSNTNIANAISKISGDYVMIINSCDIFVSTVFDNILKAIEMCDADIIHFNSCQYNQNTNSNDPLDYIFNKTDIMNFAFNYLSEFCFKRDILTTTFSSDRVILINALLNTQNMVNYSQNYLITKKHDYIDPNEYIDIIDNYFVMKKYASEKFWKKYFYNLIPKMIQTMVKSNDKEKFFIAVKKTPWKFIPWRYKIIFWVFKMVAK